MGIFDRFLKSNSLADVVTAKVTNRNQNTRKNYKQGNLNTCAQVTVPDKPPSKRAKSHNDGCYTAGLSDFEAGGAYQLPLLCPILIGGPCPDGCRFDTKFFQRMVSEGVLSTKNGCPVLCLCRVITGEKKAPRNGDNFKKGKEKNDSIT